MATRSNLLLDTCAVIWMAGDLPLDPEAERQISNAFSNNETITVSAVTAWELGLLSRRGRLPTAKPPFELFERFTNRSGVSVAPVTPAMFIDSSFLPGDFHSDPADRIVVATARALELTVVTRDSAILDYAQRGYVLALAC